MIRKYHSQNCRQTHGTARKSHKTICETPFCLNIGSNVKTYVAGQRNTPIWYFVTPYHDINMCLIAQTNCTIYTHDLGWMYYQNRKKTTSFVDLLCFCSVLFLVCFRVRLFIDALWSSAGKGLTSWLSFVMSNCEVVTFQLVSWARCCA